MEHGLRHPLKVDGKKQYGLNPCYNGTWSPTLHEWSDWG